MTSERNSTKRMYCIRYPLLIVVGTNSNLNGTNVSEINWSTKLVPKILPIGIILKINGRCNRKSGHRIKIDSICNLKFLFEIIRVTVSIIEGRKRLSDAGRPWSFNFYTERETDEACLKPSTTDENTNNLKMSLHQRQIFWNEGG